MRMIEAFWRVEGHEGVERGMRSGDEGEEAEVVMKVEHPLL